MVCCDNGACQVVSIGGVGGVRHKRLNGYFAGNLSRGVPAHAVGNGIKGRVHGKAVFVMLAHQAHVSARAVRGKGALGVPSPNVLMFFFGSHYSYLTRMATSPTLTTSLFFSTVGSVMRRPLTAVPLVEPRSSTKRLAPMMLNRAWRAET